MKKKFILLCLLCGFVAGSIAQVNSAEYFWDADPGEGNATHINISAADSVHFTTTISTASLANGFHSLYIRAKDKNGNWSLAENNSVYVYQSFNPTLPRVTKAEYFWDDDPGEGTGKTISVTSSSDSVHLTATIPATSLSQGFHALYVRTKDANNKWSFVAQQEIYLYNNFNPALPKIIAAEYFWDNDPGEGKGKLITVNPQSDSVHLAAAIAATGLQQGFHALYVRTKDANNKWSFVAQQEVYLYNNFNPALPKVVAAEYFWDDDPGEGKGTSLNAGAHADSVKFTNAIAVNFSNGGFHQLYIRTKDENNVWSFVEQRTVYVAKNSVPITDTIDKAEYFIDTDPGEGKGTKIVVNNPSDSIHQDFVITTRANIDTGYHLVFVRTHAKKQKVWSVAESAQFYVSNGVLAVSLLNFSVKNENDKVQLDWQTTNEENTLSYIVERSTNAIDFTSIATVAAINTNNKQNYTAEDNAPPAGRVYYRLKQVNKDGSFTYSKILFVDITGNVFVRCYPNPATDLINIDFPATTQKATILLFNTAGKQIMQQTIAAGTSHVQLHINNIAGGSYKIILLNADGSKQALSFIKAK